MVIYRLDFSPEGGNSLKALDREAGQRVLDKLKWLIQNMDIINPLPLKGKLSGLYKLKIGDWRVIYGVNYVEKVVTVHKVGHRREIYR